MLFYFSFGTLQLARKFFSNLASVCHVFSRSLKWGKHMRALEAWLHVFSQVKCSSFHFVCFRELWSLLQHEVFFEDLIFKTRATFSVDQEHVTRKMKNISNVAPRGWFSLARLHVSKFGHLSATEPKEVFMMCEPPLPAPDTHRYLFWLRLCVQLHMNVNIPPHPTPSLT